MPEALLAATKEMKKAEMSLMLAVSGVVVIEE
jgi:hypothetical protein